MFESRTLFPRGSGSIDFELAVSFFSRTQKGRREGKEFQRAIEMGDRGNVPDHGARRVMRKGSMAGGELRMSGDRGSPRSGGQKEGLQFRPRMRIMPVAPGFGPCA